MLGPMPDSFEPDTAFSALAAGSALKHLDLRDTKLGKEAWLGAFPADYKFDSITSLRFGDATDADSSGFDFFHAAVSACPNLRELQYTGACTAGLSVSEQMLQQATALTKLTIREAKQGYPPQLGHLSQLKSLQLLGLKVDRVERFVEDMQQLSLLTQLSFLRLEVHSQDMGPTALGSFQLLCSVFDGMAATAERCQDDKAAFATWSLVSKVGSAVLA